MSGGQKITVNDGNFQAEVLDSQIPVLIDFWAEWCGPCKMISPMIDEIAEEYGDKIKVCKLNVEEGEKTAVNYSVLNIPTVMIFKGGEVMEKIVGVVPKNSLREKINMHI